MYSSKFIHSTFSLSFVSEQLQQNSFLLNCFVSVCGGGGGGVGWGGGGEGHGEKQTSLKQTILEEEADERTARDNSEMDTEESEISPFSTTSVPPFCMPSPLRSPPTCTSFACHTDAKRTHGM